MKLRLFVLTLSVLTVSTSWAGEVYLKNGDKITGKILSETNANVVVETDAIGRITINKAYVKNTMTDEDLLKKEMAEKIKWKKVVSVGYSDSGGNTDKSSGSVEVKLNRKTEDDEYTGKISAYIGTNDNKTDSKKFYGLARYANSFGADKKWYQFAKLEASQDKFANLDYRLTPGYGAGYWFADEDDYKLMAEAALGYQYSSYTDGTKDEGEMVVVPRVYYETVVIDDLRFSQDFTLYPSLEDLQVVRLHSETALVNPLSERLAWKVSFINDYDSDPAGTAEKHDYRVVSSLDYHF